jgi:hypothetical protein
VTRTAFLAAALAVAGCDFLAPVVTTFPEPAPPPEEVCEPPPACDALAQTPLPPVTASSLDGPDDSCGTHGWTLDARTIDASTEIDAASLDCLELAIDVAPGAGAIEIAITGDVLARARIGIRSARAVALRLETSAIDASEIAVDGPIDATFVRSAVRASRVRARSDAPLADPSILVDGGSIDGVAIDAPRAEVRLRETESSEVVAVARAIALERGRLHTADLRADLLELVDADLENVYVEVDRFVAAAGRLAATSIAACRSIAISQLSLVQSYVARCDEPLDVRRVTIAGSAILADIAGDASIRGSVLGGEVVDLESGSVRDSALCALSHIAADTIDCIRCEPDAPPDVCGEIPDQELFCPGLCRSVCGETDLPAQTPDLCVR